MLLLALCICWKQPELRLHVTLIMSRRWWDWTCMVVTFYEGMAAHATICLHVCV